MIPGYSSLLIQAIEALFMSIMIGCIFINLGFDQISVRDRVVSGVVCGGVVWCGVVWCGGVVVND
jgi:hypothetical protein